MAIFVVASPDRWQLNVRSLSRIVAELERHVRIISHRYIMDDVTALRENCCPKHRSLVPTFGGIDRIDLRWRSARDECQGRCKYNKVLKHVGEKLLYHESRVLVTGDGAKGRRAYCNCSGVDEIRGDRLRFKGYLRISDGRQQIEVTWFMPLISRNQDVEAESESGHSTLQP